MPIQKIKIPAGKHKYKCFYWRFPEFLPKDINREFMFTPSCLYDLKDNDQYDVNKLFGMSFNYFPTFKEFVPHHINSVRFGWRPILENETIQIVAYEYFKNYRRPTEIICEVKINEWYSYRLCYSENKMYYKVKGEDINVLHETNYFIRNEKSLGYFLDFYFGGNEKAPQDIIVFKK